MTCKACHCHACKNAAQCFIGGKGTTSLAEWCKGTRREFEGYVCRFTDDCLDRCVEAEQMEV